MLSVLDHKNRKNNPRENHPGVPRKRGGTKGVDEKMGRDIKIKGLRKNRPKKSAKGWADDPVLWMTVTAHRMNRIGSLESAQVVLLHPPGT